MHYEIAEVSTDTRTGHTYVLVRFWASRADRIRNQPPILVNDFLMQLRATEQRIIDEETGERAEVEVDVPAQIIDNIERYIERAETRQERGERIDRRIGRDTRDPYGVLSREDVIALRGATRDSRVRDVRG